MEDDFIEQFSAMGASLALLSPADGALMLQRSTPLATKLVAVARQDPRVYKALKKYLAGSVWAMLGQEVTLIALGIAANHNIDPLGWLPGRRKGQADNDVSGVA